MPKYEPGQQVMMAYNRTRIGVIVGAAQPIADTYEYPVHFPEGVEYVSEAYLAPIELLEPRELFRNRAFAGPESLLRLVTLKRLTEPFTDTLLTRHANRIDYLPYQWMPLLRLLDTADSRIFIADEVGLGKTIEAGIILRELAARNSGLNKVLVIARGGHLNRQWRDEMRDRFGQAFSIWNAGDFVEWLEHGQREQHWDSVSAIVGRHSLMRDPAHAALRKICTVDGDGRHYSHPPIDLDLLIVDEAHHTRNRNKLHHAVGWLARSAKTVLFLSATPLHLGNDDLYNQLRILLPQRFPHERFFKDELRVHQRALRALRQLFAGDRDALTRSLQGLADGQDITDITANLDEIDQPSVRAELKRKIESFSPLSNVLNRTTRQNIPHVEWPARHAITLQHALTEREKSFYFRLWLEHYTAIRNGLPFGKTMALRLAATCMPVAMEAHSELIDDEDADEQTDERGEFAVQERVRLDFDRLANLPDSRFEVLEEALAEIWRETPRSKVIIFSFFVDVLRYLSKRFERRGLEHRVVHGQIDRQDREKLYNDFLDENNTDVKLLLSSEVGSEGLNLQVADTIVNYNLPWNPMVVEQRIGRIDRKGQRAKVIRIVNLFAEGTIEDKILGRLLKRLRIFEASIGDLEPILGGIERKLAKEFADPNLSAAEQERRLKTLADRIEQERANRRELGQAEREKLVADLPFNPVEQAREEGRFVSPLHIRLLVEEFLRRETPDSRFRYDDGICDVQIRQDLFRVLTETTRELNLNQEEGHGLERALHFNRLRLTYDENNARRPDIELVAPGHWFLRAICHHLQNRPGVIHPASAVAVQSDGGIPNGWYVYGLFVVNFRGAKDKRLLEPVFISLDSGNALEPSHSQKLLSKMLVNATAVDVQVAGLHYEPNELLQRVRDRFHVRYTKLFDDFSRETQRLLRLRRQTVERYAKAEVARIREDIARLDTEEQRRILPVWEARIRDIEQRRDNEIAIIEGQEPARSYKQVGFGLLRVN